MYRKATKIGGGSSPVQKPARYGETDKEYWAKKLTKIRLFVFRLSINSNKGIVFWFMVAPSQLKICSESISDICLLLQPNFNWIGQQPKYPISRTEHNGGEYKQ